MQPLPVVIEASNSFYPLSVTPADSLTDYLPHGCPANCLLAHAVDPRKILYTLFSEQNNGVSTLSSSNLSVRFCKNIQYHLLRHRACRSRYISNAQIPSPPPLLFLWRLLIFIARTVLLLSCLLDNPDVSTKLWNIFHDFFIGPDSMDLIQTQSAKLVELSESLTSWDNGAYGKVLRMVNSETLHALRDIWSKYSNSKRVVYPDFRNGIDRVFVEHYKFSHGFDLRAIQLNRSFGFKAMGTRLVSNRHMEQFWKNGVAYPPDTPKEPISNPLFLYTSTARDKFVVNHETNPLTIFHLVSTFHDWISQESGPPAPVDVKNIDKIIEQVVTAAKSQFSAWCTAFQQVAKESTPRVRIRFVAADPTAFCLAIEHRNLGTVCVEPSPIYSSIWSGTPLIFDGDVGDSTPLLYNVIDTSHLIDRVGAVNVLVATVPLLERSPASTIRTDTITRRWPQEPELLRRLLTTDVTWMCGLLNIAPMGYLTATSVGGISQDMTIVLDPGTSSTGPNPILSRIVWKIPASGDSNADLKRNKIRANFEFHAFLFIVANSMLRARLLRDKSLSTYGSKLPFCLYTEESLGLLFAFLKRRVILDWDAVIRALLKMALSPNLCGGIYNSSLADLGMSLHFARVYTSPSLIYNVDGDPLSNERHSRGILSLPKPPIIACVVFTVPRRNLLAIYDKCFLSTRDVICQFEMRLHYSAGEKNFFAFRSPTPIFGQLIVAKDGKKCKIETDRDGWHGSSDLHLCFCVPTTVLLGESPRTHFFTANVVSDPITSQLFRKDYGPNLEILKARIFDDTKIQLVDSFPGCPVPNPRVTADLPDTPAESNSDFSITYPEIRSLENQTKFVTRITLVSYRARELLKSGSKVTANQSSPCTLSITYETAKHVCQFPYPIQGNATSIKVARQSGWIEITIPLSVSTQNSNGGYAKQLFPLLQDPLCSWNLPSINFSQLDSIHGANPTDYVNAGLANMVIDNLDVVDPGDNDHHYLTAFKLALLRICLRDGREEPRIICLEPKVGNKELILLVLRRVLDPSSHSIVLDTYILQMTDKLNEMYSSLDDVLNSLAPDAPRTYIKVRPKDIDFWKGALPSMIERCRNWEHEENCKALHGICSCGFGKVGDEFLRIKGWTGLKPYVVRAAISPVFPVPYVVEVRAELFKAANHVSALGRWPPTPQFSPPTGSSEHVKSPHACQTCGRAENTKKCGACDKVYYCGKECQRKDWKQHKLVCRNIN